ncbi:LPP20 family lipoprotein [candidate division TA06 bacterium]|uniref:LPP20 family lipoprotein n=1 Tax=candidate division TA06 bacterium TaxID=2250710 RepID=A0A933MIE3_UNCT6|nr:LPP20 family lipoprotein [candidate division TA06 bacterium]
MFKKTLALLAILGFASLALAQVEQNIQGAGMIDWTDQSVKSTGVGALNPKLPPSTQRKNALRAAQLDAMRNMIETLNGVLLTSETTVENAMMSSDIIKTRVDGIVKNFRFTSKPRYMSDGSVEVDMEMLLTGKVGDVLYPEQMGGKTPIYANLPSGFNAQEPQTYTGLIIDATGTDAMPAMVPAILDESGEGIYGQDFVPRESAVKNGVVIYAKTMEEAMANAARVGSNPLVIKAVKSSGLNKADLIIADSDVENVAVIADNTDIYDNCRVIIVLKQ